MEQNTPGDSLRERRPRAGWVLREYLEALLIAVLFATFARTFVVQAFKIPTGSMEENLLIGDHILVNKLVYGGTFGDTLSWVLPQRQIRRGDVVVFKFPEDPSRDFIKRCVALPGDQVAVVDKELFLNGREVDDEAYVSHSDPNTYPNSVFLEESPRFRDNFGPYTVPPAHYFCMGDNRDNSHDSRFWGAVPRSYVKGRAFMIYWSFEPREPAPQERGVTAAFRDLAYSAVRFFTDTRWNRTLRIVR